jgi:hypothetical protein
VTSAAVSTAVEILFIETLLWGAQPFATALISARRRFKARRRRDWPFRAERELNGRISSRAYARSRDIGYGRAYIVTEPQHHLKAPEI